ncbi:MAG: SRPBCC domain-containing protein [Rubrivivax sp.]|nr:SRPBCC domain-containing protein [Rubrivivax sp.]
MNAGKTRAVKDFAGRSITIAIEDAFCDEHGAVNPRLPVSKGEIVFTPTDGGTRVEFAMIYEDEDALRKIVQMGFEHGIATCMDQLESLLSRRAS